ncbi:IclR family transcriptional regulator [Acidipropionibacterium timonense]|uniref:IclR family transcriptional regulator n=1 Tax=Acidipropionibacterium timonense TaxID=2161818 RepID=UPI00103103AB|nr:IclR family transcriptional regulator [Acidipropionibacterium timonense]
MTTTPAGQTTPTIRSVERALDLLGVVCDHPGITLSDAARKVDLAPSSALRLLRTLTETGHLSRSADGLYDVGPELIRIAGRVLADNSLRRICRPTMTALAAEAGESVYLSVRHLDRAMYIALATGSRAIQHRSWEGQTIPLETSASGAALTGRMGRARFAVVASGVEKDVTAIAAPICLHGETVAALSMVAPSYRLTPELISKYGALVATKAAGLSKILGDNPPPQQRRKSSRRRTTSATSPASPTEPGDDAGRRTTGAHSVSGLNRAPGTQPQPAHPQVTRLHPLQPGAGQHPTAQLGHLQSGPAPATQGTRSLGRFVPAHPAAVQNCPTYLDRSAQ